MGFRINHFGKVLNAETEISPEEEFIIKEEIFKIKNHADAEMLYLKGIENKKQEINNIAHHIVDKYGERLITGDDYLSYSLRPIFYTERYISVPYTIVEDVVDCISNILGDRFLVESKKDTERSSIDITRKEEDNGIQ